MGARVALHEHAYCIYQSCSSINMVMLIAEWLVALSGAAIRTLEGHERRQ